jgi:hypothetical protein
VKKINSCILLANSFVHCSFSWTPKNANRVSHVLGRWAVSFFLLVGSPLPGLDFFCSAVRVDASFFFFFW